MITDFYHMVQKPDGDTGSHMMSHDPMAPPPHSPNPQQMGSFISPPFSLSEALRMTMSSGDEEEGSGESQAQSQTATIGLSVPEDMPVDLRAKLAVCLIHMGGALPEVRRTSHC